MSQSRMPVAIGLAAVVALCVIVRLTEGDNVRHDAEPMPPPPSSSITAPMPRGGAPSPGPTAPPAATAPKVEREPVPAGDPLALGSLGRLGDADEASVKADLQQQLALLRAQTKKPPADALAAVLQRAETARQEALLTAAIAQVEAHAYRTFASGGRAPAPPAGTERLVHGTAGTIGDTKVDVAIDVPTTDPELQRATETFTSAYDTYWNAQVEAFNALTLEERQRRIERHQQAERQRAGTDAGPRMSPEELERVRIRGPVAIDANKFTLSRSR